MSLLYPTKWTMAIHRANTQRQPFTFTFDQYATRYTHQFTGTCIFLLVGGSSCARTERCRQGMTCGPRTRTSLLLTTLLPLCTSWVQWGLQCQDKDWLVELVENKVLCGSAVLSEQEVVWTIDYWFKIQNETVRIQLCDETDTFRK